MRVSYDLAKINNVLQSFYNATGMNIQLRRDDYSFIANTSRISTEYCRCIQQCESGKTACRKSDVELVKKCSISRRSEMHICHAGLADVAVPIMNEDDILGYIILGQMRVDSDFDNVSKKLAALPLDMENMKQFYMNLPVFDEAKINSIVNIATIIAEHILIGNMLSVKRMDFSESIEGYVKANIDRELSVKDICENIGISKSALYTNMHLFKGCTVSEYINAKRVEKSSDLLINTDYSLEMISQMCGFGSNAYFSRIYKKIMGISPLKYRKEHSRS